MYFSKCRVEYKCKLTSELKLKIHTEGFFFFFKDSVHVPLTRP